jgi:Flp pilus assembly protein TadD
LEEARAEFQTALRIFQNYPEAMEDFGLLESRLGHHEDARRLFERALSLTAKGSPDHYFMEVNLATELIRLGESEEALKHLNQVIDEWAGYSPAWLGRAVIRYQRGEMAGARADAEAALRLDTSNAQARRLLNSLNVLATAPSR